MLKFTFIFALALALLLPTPSVMAAAGTGHWPKSSDPILIIDEVAQTIPTGKGRVRGWRRMRGRVLRDYAKAGFTFAVVERPPGNCDASATVAGAILLCLSNIYWGWPGETNGYYPNDHIPAGVATVPFQRYQAAWCHEIGHALGLGHSSSGCMTTGVHAGYYASDRPSNADLDSLRAARDHPD